MPPNLEIERLGYSRSSLRDGSLAPPKKYKRPRRMKTGAAKIPTNCPPACRPVEKDRLRHSHSIHAACAAGRIGDGSLGVWADSSVNGSRHCTQCRPGWIVQIIFVINEVFGAANRVELEAEGRPGHNGIGNHDGRDRDEDQRTPDAGSAGAVGIVAAFDDSHFQRRLAGQRDYFRKALRIHKRPIGHLLLELPVDIELSEVVRGLSRVRVATRAVLYDLIQFVNVISERRGATAQ